MLDNIQGTLDNTGWTSGTPPDHQPPTSVTDALLPTSTTNLPAGAIEKIEPRFDVSVNRANARSFFISLVKGTPYNIVVHPEVTGKITLNLQDVTIPEVMEMAYNTYGYEYEKISSGFIVHPNKIQSKIFKMNYLNVTREGQSATRISSGQSTENSNSSSTGSSGSTRQTSSQSILAASSIKTESKLDFWGEIEAAIGGIIGSDEGKSVIISPQSGLIIIRAYPSELRKAQDFLQSAEIIMQRQVILEAKIIEVELKDGYQQGINWSSLSDSGNTLIGQTGGGTLLQDGTSIIGGSTGNLDPSNYAQIAGNAASAFGGMFTLAVKSGNFAAFFEFLETQGNMQVLSSPRVSTINNQKAVIKVGSDEFFLTDISTTTTTGVTTTTTPDITLTPFFSGISLDVTPQIDENGSIILHIHPTISDVVDQTKVFTIADDQTLSLPLAFSQVRESDSIVYAKNGEIVVIGGLMTNKLIEEESGTPFLSSIPILGNLFKHASQEEVKSELVILLKPIVIDNADSWTSVIGESSNRVKQLYHEYNN
ncbi:MAG: pilus (MSHA type) biogenesis protein MshL [Gammaproteobacteria bacterium]|nr:pilus (MSHA type) biogenesis protein MshL [Gammaproteobacteria bacterium]